MEPIGKLNDRHHIKTYRLIHANLIKDAFVCKHISLCRNKCLAIMLTYLIDSILIHINCMMVPKRDQTCSIVCASVVLFFRTDCFLIVFLYLDFYFASLLSYSFYLRGFSLCRLNFIPNNFV